MLDRLPPELLRHIFDFAAPLHYSPQRYIERRATLRGLSLVSQYFREIAQPMLPEVFRADPTSFPLLQRGEIGGAIKLLFVSVLQPAALATALSLCSAVVEFRVYLCTLRVDKLAFLPDLRRLSLSQSTLYLPAGITPPTLPLLDQLSLSDTAVDPDNLYHLLNRQYLPSLRAVGLEAVKRRTDDESLFRIDEEFGRQLEIVALDLETRRQSDPSLASAPSLALLTDSVGQLEPEEAAPIRHLSLRYHRDYAELKSASSTTLRQDVAFFVKQIVRQCFGQKMSSLRHLDLPDFLSPARNLLSARLADIRHEYILEPSRAKGVELSWTPYRDPDDEAAESVVPLALWRAMRREGESQSVLR
ncbi:hypothetical protein JCM6882_000492 [Rhodosporidiobolus microsporus]